MLSEQPDSSARRKVKKAQFGVFVHSLGLFFWIAVVGSCAWSQGMFGVLARRLWNCHSSIPGLPPRPGGLGYASR